jgi:SAM-dependent methyltransferase
MMKRDTSTETWEAVADDWIGHAGTNDYRNQFLMPRTLDMIGDLRGRRVLDLGCGEGGYAREMARRGARVVGVDGSSRLIDVARERTNEEGVEVVYYQANASALDPIDSASFDLVLASMSLMDVEDYPGAMSEADRVLVSGGELLMSITHPCFSAPVSKWIRDGGGPPRFFAVDRYFDRAVWPDHITSAFRAPVLRRHRTLEDYLSGALAAGLELREFREPAASDDDVRLSARFEYLTRVPYFLFMRWRKP